MIPEIFAGTEHFTASHLQKRRYVEQCDLVICISESTRVDMLEHYGSVSAEIRVVPLSVRHGFSPTHPALPDLPRDYLLYVGARTGYKDFALLPRAMQHLIAQGLEVPVVAVGKPFDKTEIALMESLGVRRLFSQRSLPDAALQRAYANCTALIQTSRYEGFGLTPLEGMASGVPVVVARASSMPEVGGDAARYFVAGNAEDLAQQVADILEDGALRSELARRGLQRAALFTPGRTASLTADAYRSVL